VAAAVITWVCSLLLGGLFVFGAAWLMSSPDTLLDEMSRQNPELVRDGEVTVGMLRAVLGVLTGAVIVWVVAACVCAFFVLRGAGWARVLLLVSSAIAGLGLLVTTIVNAGMVVPLVGAAAVVALLLRRDVSGWFRTQRR
jgi:cytochrome c biogenesis protein CcdA